MSKTCAEAFDNLTPPEVRLALLQLLGFDVDKKYRVWEEIDLRYNCLMYEVQEELRKCYIRGGWRHPETLKKIQPGGYWYPKPSMSGLSRQTYTEPHRASALMKKIHP